jgi:transglutaminase-like putative cysteine protease
VHGGDVSGAVRYRVRHETRYVYEHAVAHSHQQLHLTPRHSARQSCEEHSILVDPTPSTLSEHEDAFGNTVTRFELDRPHETLDVVADMTVSVQDLAPPPIQEGECWESVRDQLCYAARARSAEWIEAVRYRTESPHVRIKKKLGEFARSCLSPEQSVLAVVELLNAKVHEEFTYAPGETHIATPVSELLESRRGVCQDYAHFMIACLRSVGLSARYVSGYLRTLSAADEERKGADASHAWMAVFAPPFGWVEFDPTNNLRVEQEHIALGWGRDFSDVSPLRGVILGGADHTLEVRVEVEPLPA